MLPRELFFTERLLPELTLRLGVERLGALYELFLFDELLLRFAEVVRLF